MSENLQVVRKVISQRQFTTSSWPMAKLMTETQPCGHCKQPAGAVHKCTCGAWMHGFCGEGVGEEQYGQTRLCPNCIQHDTKDNVPDSEKDPQKWRAVSAISLKKGDHVRISSTVCEYGNDYIYEVKKNASLTRTDDVYVNVKAIEDKSGKTITSFQRNGRNLPVDIYASSTKFYKQVKILAP